MIGRTVPGHFVLPPPTRGARLPTVSNFLRKIPRWVRREQRRSPSPLGAGPMDLGEAGLPVGVEAPPGDCEVSATSVSADGPLRIFRRKFGEAPTARPPDTFSRMATARGREARIIGTPTRVVRPPQPQPSRRQRSPANLDRASSSSGGTTSVGPRSQTRTQPCWSVRNVGTVRPGFGLIARQ